MSAPFSPKRSEVAGQSFTTLERYWKDPKFAAECEAEGRRLNAASMAKIDAGIAAYRARRGLPS